MVKDKCDGIKIMDKRSTKELHEKTYPPWKINADEGNSYLSHDKSNLLEKNALVLWKMIVEVNVDDYG